MTRLKWLSIGRVLIPNICFFNIIIVFEVSHLWHPQKRTNKWPSHFHHPAKWTIDLLFKIMESATTCQIKKNPSQPSFCVDINLRFLSGFLKLGLSHVWIQMTFWILSKFNQVMFCQAIKETKLIFPTISVTFWIRISNDDICLLFGTRFYFWNVNYGKGKLK